jgi:hypothetical protein
VRFRFTRAALAGRSLPLYGMLMKAWQLGHLGGTLRLNDVAKPEPRPGSVLVRMETSALLSYLKAYVAGSLPTYKAPTVRLRSGPTGSVWSRRWVATCGKSRPVSA